MAVSFRTGHVEAGPSAGKGSLGRGLLAFPCLQVVRLGGSARKEWLGGRGSSGFAATEESHWKVLDMSGPLGCQLEELDVTPFNSIDGHSQHGLLLFCRADEAADALDDLALRIHLLFPGLLAQEDSGHCKAAGTPSGLESQPPLPPQLHLLPSCWDWGGNLLPTLPGLGQEKRWTSMPLCLRFCTSAQPVFICIARPRGQMISKVSQCSGHLAARLPPSGS